MFKLNSLSPGALLFVCGVAFCVSCIGAPRDGGDDTGEGEGEGEGEVTDSTAVVIGFMDIAHTQMRSTFATQEDRLSADLSASGELTGGNHIIRSINENLGPGIDGFFSAVAGFSANQDGPIDGVRLRAATDGYRADDLAFFSVYYQSVPWITRESAREAAVSDARDTVNLRYTAGAAQLP